VALACWTVLALAGAAALAQGPTRDAAPPGQSVGPARRAATGDAAADDTVPRYRAQLPPALTLTYEVRHGMLRGTGELQWRPNGDRYELSLRARVAGLTVLTQTSTGAIDASGLAPQHYADQRWGRPDTSATLDRASRVITFSDRVTRFDWREGTQDRLSWMLQLGAVVSADDRLAQPGARVAMVVVGTHGDLDIWSFRCMGVDRVASRDGTLGAIKYVRETRASGDTAVEVWVDPSEHHLPVRATQRSGAGDDGFELQLRQAVAVN